MAFFRRKFVTPFSTLANNKGSYPTYSTTTGLLRSGTRTSGKEFPRGFAHFFVRAWQHRKVFYRLPDLVWSTPPKNIAEFSWPGGLFFFLRDKWWQKKTSILARRACRFLPVLIHTVQYVKTGDDQANKSKRKQHAGKTRHTSSLGEGVADNITLIRCSQGGLSRRGGDTKSSGRLCSRRMTAMHYTLTNLKV